VDGKTPKSMAPSLFVKSRRKKMSVYNALHRNKWIAHILPLQTPQEIQECVALWELVSRVRLEENSEDTIRWRWTSNGEYTTKSAYHIQFEGGYSKLKLMPIWRAKAEHKCRFFAWTLIHKKILTANNLAKRNWTNDPICKLCGNEPETPAHLCKDCPYSKQVWSCLRRWLNLSVLDSVDMSGSIHRYWHKCRAKFERTQRRKIDGIMIYLWWHIWKEWNRRTFQNKALTSSQVAQLCKDDILQYQLATTPGGEEA
jgi:hypothetical protein